MTVENRLRRLAGDLRPWLLGAAASSALSLIGTALVLRLWRANLDVPLASGGDANPMLMAIRNMQVSGWPRSTPLLNAPLGQDMLGFPNSTGDLWNLTGLKLLSFVLTPAQTVNAAYLFGFALVAAFAFVSLHALRVPARFAVPLAAVYSWLPYHFLRGVGHLFLSNYAAIPLACALAVAVYRDGSVRRPRTRRGRILIAGACAALLGGTGVYYAAFALVLLAAAAVLGALARRSWRPFVPAVAMGAVIGAVAIMPAAPSIIYRLQGGVLAVEGRSYGASEFYGLKITNLLLPMGGHRVPFLGDLKAGTATSMIPGEGSETLGLLGVAGLIAVVVAVLLPATRADGRLAAALQPLGALAIVSLLTATVAGLNSTLVLAGLAELRAWNRMSVVIAFLALAGLGYLLDATWVRWVAPARLAGLLRPAASLAAVGFISVIGLLDQTTNNFIPDHLHTAAAWQADERYFGEVEAELGAGTQVFQLPVARFPEVPPIVDMADYEHLRGYLHSDLSWSYGGLKGGRAEWQGVAMTHGLTQAIPALVAAGFDAVYVNRLGYEDRGAAVEAELRAVAGEPLVNEDGTLAVYDLREYAAELRARGTLPSAGTVLNPVRLELGEGAYPPESADDTTWQWLRSETHANLINSDDKDRAVLITATLVAASPQATVTVRIGEEETTVHLVDGHARLLVRTTVPPGHMSVTITTDSAQMSTASGDQRDLRLQMLGLRVAG